MGKLIIFDLDGTLLNTIADLGKACNFALELNGLPQHPLEEYNKMVGGGARSLIQNAAPGVSETRLEAILHDFRRYYDTHCRNLTYPYPGIPELIDDLLARNCILAVCSNKYQRATEKIIDYYFPEVFAAVYGESEGISRKPAPDALLAIMKELEFKPEEIVMVGDSDVDVEAARNAGIASIAVTWGFQPEFQLRAARPDHLVSSPDEILRLLKGA